jgi:hypothetical protein
MRNRAMDEPAFSREDWLPERAEWPELAELRERHVALLRTRQALAHERADLRRRFEAEDEARKTALQDAYAAGEQAPTLPEKGTATEEREAARQEINDRLASANAAFKEFIDEAVETIRERAPDWMADLDTKAAAAESKRQEAARLLAEAEAAESQFSSLRRWVERTARDRTGMHIGYTVLNAPSRPLLRVMNEGVMGGPAQHPDMTVEEFNEQAMAEAEAEGAPRGNQLTVEEFNDAA